MDLNYACRHSKLSDSLRKSLYSVWECHIYNNYSALICADSNLYMHACSWVLQSPATCSMCSKRNCTSCWSANENKCHIFNGAPDALLQADAYLAWKTYCIEAVVTTHQYPVRPKKSPSYSPYRNVAPLPVHEAGRTHLPPWILSAFCQQQTSTSKTCGQGQGAMPETWCSSLSHVNIIILSEHILGLPLGLFHPSGSCWIFMLHIRWKMVALQAPINTGH